MSTLKFGTKLTASTMRKGMLVMISSYHARQLGLEKTIAVIDSLQMEEVYPCLIKPIWSPEGVDRNSMLATKASELRCFGIAKEKNKFSPSPIFAWKPKLTVELMG